MKKIIFLFLSLIILCSPAYSQTITLKIDGSQGKLSAVIQKPELNQNQKCQLVMLLHGFTGNKSNRPLIDIADLLEKNNIASIRFDFNGHGESDGEFKNMTVLNEIEDAKKVFDYVKTLDYVEKISIAGHSQGGVVTSMLAGELGAENVHKIVLLAPAAVLRDDAIRGNVMGTYYDAGNPPETVKIFGRYNLGRDYMITSQSLKIYETAEKFNGPACIIHGTADRIVPYTYGEGYHKIYVNSELHLLDGADHGFNNYDEEAAKLTVDFLMK